MVSQVLNLIRVPQPNTETLVPNPCRYDVLNQRFVMRTDSKTGKVTRMLRLAIGSRSQLCPVADSFKIVVVGQSYGIGSKVLPGWGSPRVTKPCELPSLCDWCEGYDS